MGKLTVAGDSTSASIATVSTAALAAFTLQSSGTIGRRAGTASEGQRERLWVLVLGLLLLAAIDRNAADPSHGLAVDTRVLVAKAKRGRAQICANPQKGTVCRANARLNV